MGEGSELIPGVRAIEHTADLGFEVSADSLPQLFDRAAAGMMALLRDDAAAPSSPTKTRELGLAAADAASLLALWLRELLYLHDVHGFEYVGAAFAQLDERALRARVRGAHLTSAPARELKGVTYHGLEVVRSGAAWRARVIFDV